MAQHKVTPEHAREAYGVVLTPAADAVDVEATTALRRRMGEERGPLPTEPEVLPSEQVYPAAQPPRL